ncbi:MAG: deoxyribonuclease IV [Clostridiales bacterium]|uniref:deoxyribonuclease IV n=1 Tax=Clostridium sp. N3C TaxID=1776758 RepID=UPI00092DF5F3|nr:deoxyribonuclease IV [Clostridium sp. N3C]NLZ48057.1 deoxyribonuclease IV [Clostridiales bacterium]SCN22205.1 putative endonuclease 4 [Clostridium sp. N3C]
MLKIGSHVSMSGKKMLLGSAEEAASYGANVFMVYTGAPQNTIRKPIENLNIEAAINFMKKNNIDEIIVHAPYIINLGNSVKMEIFQLAINFLREEIRRAEALKKAKQIILHPGSHVGAGEDKGIERIIEGLNEVITKDQSVQIALETMAGKGSECGKSFEQLARIIDGVKYNEKISVCMDTCHVHDAGYDIVHKFDLVLEEFNKIIGLDRLKVIHLNDSKNPLGSKKDRHELIGYGYIGFDALCYIAHHESLKDIPKILETPYVDDGKGNKKSPYKYEIEMIKEKVFNRYF